MFNFSPLFDASFTVQTHVYAAVLSLLLGIWIMFGTKGTKLHKRVGKVWVIALLITAVSSFWLHGIKLVGPFSPIHLLSILTIYSVIRGVQHARAGQIGQHQNTMKGLFYYALIGAGLFTLLPGRLMHQLLLG
ncbi:MAG: DUF2306 domain-containing protein [Lentilitoribacter sp.]